MARSTSLSKGGIAGVVLGVFFGLLLVFLCVFPFLKRARRRRRDAALTTEEGMTEAPYSHAFLGDSPFANTLRRLSHGAPARPAAVVPGAGSDGDSAEKPEQSVFVSHTLPQKGSTSPVSPQHDAVNDFERLHGKDFQDGRTATGSPTTLEPETTRDSKALGAMLSKETTTAGEQESRNSLQKQSVSTYAASPISRQGTFGSHGITEEPESLSGQGGLSHQGSQASHRRKRSGSRNLSDSIRQLAYHVSTAMRHDSIVSTESARGSFTARSPIERPDALVHSQTAPPIMEAEFIDTEAPGLAYDYYHPSPGDDMPPGPEHSASYGPPLSIPDTFAEPSTLPGSFISPTSAATVTPVGAMPPATRPYAQNTWVEPGIIGGQEDGTANQTEAEAAQDKRWPPRPLQRTGTLPLQAFTSDLPSPPLPSTEQKSVDPREVMKPSTRNEMDFEVKQELVKLTTPSPPAEHDAARAMPAFPVQPTPDPTPEPEVAPQHGWESEITANARGELPWMAPDVAVDSGDNAGVMDVGAYDDEIMTDVGQWETEQWQSPAQAVTPSHLTSYGTPHSMSTAESHPPTQLTTPNMGAHSPQVVSSGSLQGDVGPVSDYTSSERASQSPGQYACHECERVFDQLHKLQ